MLCAEIYRESHRGTRSVPNTPKAVAEGINTPPLWAERLGVHMVKRPRQVMRYSPSAGKHTLHTVERVKKKRASELRWGQRRFRRVMAGYRGFPRPKPDGREKPTKRVNILYRCTETGKAHYAPCKRAKKFELIDR